MTGCAVIIGFGVFKSDAIKNLEGVKGSTTLMNDILGGGRRKKIPLYKVKDTILDEDPSVVEKRLTKVLETTSSSEPVLVYVVGHGDVTKNGGFRLPTGDADPSAAGMAQWVKFQDNIAAILRGTGEFKKAVVLVDACRSGAINQGNDSQASQHRTAQDASGNIENSVEVELTSESLDIPDDDKQSGKKIVFLTSSSRDQKSFEIKPYECEALPTLMNAYKEWEHAPEVERMTAFAHAIGFAVYLGNIGPTKILSFKLPESEADFASEVQKIMRFDDEGDITVANLRDAVHTILAKQNIPQIPAILPQEDSELHQLHVIRTTDRAKKDSRRELTKIIDGLQNVTAKTRTSMKAFCAKMSGGPGNNNAVEMATRSDYDWEDYLFTIAKEPEAEFVEKYIERSRSDEVENEVALRERAIEDEYRVRIASRDRKISLLEDDFRGAMETTGSLQLSVTALGEDRKRDKVEADAKIGWWRNIASVLAVVVAAAVTFLIVHLASQ